jgi:hypothetical protein
MEDKYYYTPTIEEFYVGFEFELKDYLEYQIDKDVHVLNRGWDKQVVTFDFFTKNKLMPYFLESTRVKYLDQSDIESLGWVDGERYGVSGLVFNYGDKNDNWQIYTQYDTQFYAIYSITGIIFQGFIKNKSELKKLMQQLDIK